MSLQLPTIITFPDPHQYENVGAGEQEKVLKVLIPGGNTGFIQRISNTFFNTDVQYFSIDGKRVENQIQRAVGTFANPLEVNPWFRMPVKKDIKWEVHNKDTVAHDYEVALPGFYVADTDLESLFRLAGASLEPRRMP